MYCLTKPVIASSSLLSSGGGRWRASQPAAAFRPAGVRPLPVPLRAFREGDMPGGGGTDPVRERAAEAARTASQEAEQPVSGLVFQGPMSEIAPMVADLDTQLMSPRVPGAGPSASLARTNYAAELEAGINEQINIELNMSYVYTAMYSYFLRDDVGLPGFAAYFRHNSDDERTHAHRLLEYQTRRGGRVKLATISSPETEFWHAEKGDALFATELALSLEKLNFTKLRELHALATKAEDADTTHFIEDHLLSEQGKDVKEAAVLVSQVRRAGRGHGVFHVDTLLARKYDTEGDGAGPIAG